MVHNYIKSSNKPDYQGLMSLLIFLQMKSQRQLQVGEQIKRIIADIFLREGLMTIMGNYITILEADASPDIKNVRIYLDIFGDTKNRDQILARLNNAAPHFRHELGKRLSSRNTPEISFILDRTEENALRLEALIDQESQAILNPKPKPKKPVTKKSSAKKPAAKSPRKKKS